jgi:cytochrome c biogenesis protein CcmG, thiol:disulfide interchange protein DsbE
VNDPVVNDPVVNDAVVTGTTNAHTARRAWLTAAGVVVLILVALVINRATAKSNKPSAQRSALIAQANLPDCPAPSGSASVANGLPSLKFPCLANGPTVNLGRLRGPLVVNVWAGPCTECRAEAPELHAFAVAAVGKVAMLGVVDGAYNGAETWDDALDASRGLGLTYPSVWDANGSFVQWTRAAGIPVTLFVKPDGAIAHRKVGTLAPGELAALTKQYLGVDVAAT